MTFLVSPKNNFKITSEISGQQGRQQLTSREGVTSPGGRGSLSAGYCGGPINDADVAVVTTDTEAEFDRVSVDNARKNTNGNIPGAIFHGNMAICEKEKDSGDAAVKDVKTNSGSVAVGRKRNSDGIFCHRNINSGNSLPFRSLLPVLALLSLLASGNCQEKRCVCSLRDNTALSTYDHERLQLPLPCNYKLTSIKTRNGRCQITVDLAMTTEDGQQVRPSGLRFLVTQDGYSAGGVIDHRGITPIDRNLRPGSPLVLPEMTSANGVSILAYQDESQSFKLSLTECKVTLYYKPDDYLGVYSHDYSSSYLYNPRDLCGDCDGTRNEVMMKLPPDMLGHIRSLKERDAAMLYMTSAHISGGPQKCFDYRNLISSCRKTTLLWALQVCGQLFNTRDPLPTCLARRTKMGQVLDTYFNCVSMFCRGDSRTGCRYIYDLASTNFCSVPRRMGC